MARHVSPSSPLGHCHIALLRSRINTVRYNSNDDNIYNNRLLILIKVIVLVVQGRKKEDSYAFTY